MAGAMIEKSAPSRSGEEAVLSIWIAPAMVNFASVLQITKFVPGLAAGCDEVRDQHTSTDEVKAFIESGQLL
ncbi:MAG TPA: hypothetical protein VFY92_04975 [Hyphomicrobiaceae bacterium]|nr:hypothetical protein [Hyphomicrobiaceae bacterium]